MYDYNTTFNDYGFGAGDVVVCTGTTLGAPKGVIGKAFVLENILDGSTEHGQAGISLGDNDHYLGENAKWRRATISDVARSVATMRWENDVQVATPGQSLGAWVQATGNKLTNPYTDIPDEPEPFIPQL